MTENLINYINQIVPLSQAETDTLQGVATLKKLKKKELFVRAGQVCNKALFCQSGYFRFYHQDENGKEITSDFYFAPTFITSYTSFISGKPSLVNVQAMMDMDALEFKKGDLYNLYDKHPKFERLGRLIAESVAINSEEHLFLLINQPAEIRYKKLIERNPGYVQTIPLQYIASYLGITQETLSRMRKNIH